MTVLELQRERPGRTGHFVVGGLIELVTIRRDQIESRVLKRWPDLVGEPIEPEPMDWPAWRARRADASVASIPAGLSRLQRERMEKKARKGTLRAV
jgi:hypothetical protein